MTPAERPPRPLGPLTAAQQQAVDAGRCMLAPGGCDGPRHGAWLCAAHGMRWLRRGDLGDPVVVRKRRKLTVFDPPVGGGCGAPVPGGCPEPHHALGLCGGHYSRLLTRGAPGVEPVAKRAKWTPPDAADAAVRAALELAGGNVDLLRWNPRSGQIDVLPQRPLLTRGQKAARGVGRPPALTDEQVQQARERVAQGWSVIRATRHLGVHHNTLRRYLGGWRPARREGQR